MTSDNNKYINILQTIIRASTSLRDVCGGHSVQDLIENREAVSEELQEIIGPIAKSWGVKVSILQITIKS